MQSMSIRRARALLDTAAAFAVVLVVAALVMPTLAEPTRLGDAASEALGQGSTQAHGALLEPVSVVTLLMMVLAIWRHRRYDWSPAFLGLAAALCYLSSLAPSDAPRATLPFVVFGLAVALPRGARTYVFCVTVALVGIRMWAGLFLYAAGLLRLPYGHAFETPGFGMRFGGVLGTPNSEYPLALIGLVGFTALAVRWRNERLGGLFGVCSFGCLAALLTSYSRAGWLGLAVVASLLAFQVEARARRLLLSGALALITGAAMVRTGTAPHAILRDASALSRAESWHTALTLAGRRPWRGLGQGAFARERSETLAKDASSLWSLPREPKSAYLALLVEQGLPGLLAHGAFALALFRVCVRVLRDRGCSPTDRAIAGSAAGVLVGLAVAGLFDAPLSGTGERLPSASVTLLPGGLAAAAARSLPHALAHASRADATAAHAPGRHDSG